MRIRVLSDLHLEFMPDWRQWVKSLDNECDVLVLAGDICSWRDIPSVMFAFCRRFENVIYVLGNHEFYGTTPAALLDILDGTDMPDNLHWLENGVVSIDMLKPVRFVGTSLWFPEPSEHVFKRGMNDFYQIRDFEPWVYEQNRRAVEYLVDAVRPGDVVVTHHLPHPMSVHRKYEGSPLNAFFMCDMEHVIDDRKPRLWIHGHTHESCDYMLGDTRIVCNPYGYSGHETNAAFDSRKIVEVAQ